jgi:hypothetical protein
MLLQKIRTYIRSLDYETDGFHGTWDYLFCEIVAMCVLAFVLDLLLSILLMALFETASYRLGISMRAYWGDAAVAAAVPAVIASFVVTFVARGNPFLINYSQNRPHRFHRH